MKKQYKIVTGKGIIEREYNYIPVRYIIAVLLGVLEIAMIISIVLALCYIVPYFYTLCIITGVACMIRIISSDDNPDYKIPWLLCVIFLPIVGFMLYFMFYSRKLKKRFIKHAQKLEDYRYATDDEGAFAELESEDRSAASQAKMLTEISASHLYKNTEIKYFSSGEELRDAMICDIAQAEKFIFLEYFIIEEGSFWNSILELLIKKVGEGVDVRVMYDDIGCMSTLPGNYYKILQKHGIKATVFSKLRGSADSEFNNRSHRKILVVDGKVAYTGGVNIADEYVNKKLRFGHWKDIGIRIVGEAVCEMTQMFLFSFGLNSEKLSPMPDDVYPEQEMMCKNGYVIPFGDGPKPMYMRNVSKSAIQNIIGAATDYVYMTTPYLIIDNDLCADIERAALRGVDIRIVVPHIPDKRLVFGITRSFYHRLMSSGVKIYEYEPGFIHAKTYLADGKYAIVGTPNLDYRSLVHHFENGVWMYKTDCISDIKRDIDVTLEKSILITPDMLKTGIIARFIRSIVKIFAPML